MPSSLILTLVYKGWSVTGQPLQTNMKLSVDLINWPEAIPPKKWEGQETMR